MLSGRLLPPAFMSRKETAMAKLMNYRVIREHGDFAEGAIRTAAPNDVAHLVPKSLELIGPAKDQPDEKTNAEPDNKAFIASPANKAASRRGSKGK